MKQLPQTSLLLFLCAIPLIRPLWGLIETQLWLDPEAWLPLLGWVMGCVLGVVVLSFDQLLDVLVINPQSNLATTVRSYFSRKHLHYGLRLLSANKHLQPRLSFRSALFQLIWVVLTVFTFSSTSSIFGKGFVLAIGVKLLLEQWSFYFANSTCLRQWLFWQVKREFSHEELKWYLVAITTFTILLTLTVQF